MFKYFS